MERGSINGTPVWVRVASTTIGERTIVHEAPSVNGAVIQTQGLMPEKFALEFKLVQDGEWVVSDAETATLELRSTFLLGAPFTVLIPAFGEVTGLYLAEPVSLNFFDDSRRLLSEGSATFVDGDPLPLLQESSIADVTNAVAQLSAAAQIDLANRFPDTGVFQAALDSFDSAFDWMDSVQQGISTAFEPVNDVAGALADLRRDINTLVFTPQTLAFRMMSTGAALLSLVPSLSQQGSARDGSAVVQDPTSDKPAIVFAEALESGAVYDSEDDPTQGDTLGDEASEEDLQENDERGATQSLVLSTVAGSVCLAITSSTFASSDSLFALSEALYDPVWRLLNLPDVDYRVWEAARYLWKSTLAFLQDEAADLPRIRVVTTSKDTDAMTLAVELHEGNLDGIDDLQLAIDQLVTINDVPDALTIRRGTTLRYLDPPT